MNINRRVAGLDFGTTNTVAALADAQADPSFVCLNGGDAVLRTAP